jgi:beta-phosphoglucomutase-like phosphatase (HAD superfamily)
MSMTGNERTYPRLSRAAQAELLRRIIARCKSQSGAPTPVVVFDLDGTLLDNRPRTCAILHELARELRATEPDAALLLAAARPDALAYLLTDSLGRLGIHRTDLVARAETFWRERFFADHHLEHDVEVPGAVAFARACHEAGATLVYMTGRDLPLMGIGSFRSLRDLGFPIGLAGTELVLKPDAAMPDEAFKRLTGPQLGRIGAVVAIFDNEPANCNVLLDQHPGADSVLVDTQHLPGAPALDARVKVIADLEMG